MRKNFIIMLLALLSINFNIDAKEAKYVFYFIGDGMGLGHVNAAQYYNRMVRGVNDPLLMQQFPYMGVATTYSANAPVTDSAAAGTALATGHKTKNGMVGLAPDSITPFESIASRLKKQGWGVGVITSVSADDATPAAFYAHRIDRGMSAEIDYDGAHSGFDFIGGANLKGTSKTEGLNLIEFKKNGYATLTSTTTPVADDIDKILLLSPQGNGDIGYTIDSIPDALKLADMTTMALSFLEKKTPDRFFLMVEGGNIDHAAHANDGGTVIKEIIAFQDAIKVAYDFYLAHPDETLIVVTADHDTGGLALNGKVDLSNIYYQRISKDALSDMCKQMAKDHNAPSWGEMKKFLTKRLGLWKNIKVNKDQEKAIKKAYDKTFVMNASKDQKGLYNSFNEFVVEVFNVMNYRIGTHFTTRSHSANPVPVYAIGVGSERFSGTKDNTEIPEIIISNCAVK